MLKLGAYNTLLITKRVDFGLYLSPIEGPSIEAPRRSSIEASRRSSIAGSRRSSIEASRRSSIAGSRRSSIAGSLCSGAAAAPASPAAPPSSPSPYSEILLPQRYVTPQMRIGDQLEVFLYLDHDERIVATTEHPLATVGEFAYLKCAWTNEYGAFLAWGLQKDLFCPFREQKQRMERGHTYYVYVMEDPVTHRLMATAKVERYQKTTGRQRALDFAEVLLRHLHENDGYCPLGDHSPADAIAARFGVSKKAYKQAVGDLYRRRLITIAPDGIRLA